MSRTYNFDLAQILGCALIGVFRQTQNILKKRNHAHNLDKKDETGWQFHIEGAMGEYVVSKILGLPWNAIDIGDLNLPDVGENIEVRTTRYLGGKLIVHEHPSDPKDRIYWLVTGQNGKYCIRGWLEGEKCQQQKYWENLVKNQKKEPRYAFCVPQDNLNTLEDYYEN